MLRMRKIMIAAAFTAAMTMWGCGAEEVKQDNIMKNTTIIEEIPQTEGVDNDKSNEGRAGTKDNEETKDNAGAEDIGEREDSTAGRSEEDSKAELQELVGNIESVEANRFIVSEIHTEVDEDGGMLAYSGPDEKLIIVNYGENTDFTVHTTNDGGITSTEEVGAKEDLAVGHNAILLGNWNGDEFQAEYVNILIIN